MSFGVRLFKFLRIREDATNSTHQGIAEFLLPLHIKGEHQPRICLSVRVKLMFLLILQMVIPQLLPYENMALNVLN